MSSSLGTRNADKIERLLQESSLTVQQQAYVRARVAGAKRKEAARLAGYHESARLPPIDAAVEEVLKQCIALANSASQIIFDRAQAHELLMGAYRNAATAGEQVAAVREMIKLHGLAAPQKIEHKHVGEITHDYQVKQLTTEELVRLAQFPRGLTLDGDAEEVLALPHGDQEAN